MVVPIYVLFLQDMRKTFIVELRKLMTGALWSQDQMSDVDTINQAKRQGYIATFDVKCRCIYAIWHISMGEACSDKIIWDIEHSTLLKDLASMYFLCWKRYSLQCTSAGLIYSAKQKCR